MHVRIPQNMFLQMENIPPASLANYMLRNVGVIEVDTFAFWSKSVPYGKEGLSDSVKS